MTTRISAPLFMLAAHAISDEWSRYYLQGVRIEPHPDGGVLMASTDGHRMVVVHDKDGQCDQPAIVKLPRRIVRNCRNRSAERPRFLHVDNDAKTARLAEESTQDSVKALGDLITVHDVIVDGTYPDWKAVIPNPTGAAVGAFNPKYLKSFGRLGKLITKTLHPKGDGMRMWQENADAPAVLRWEGVDILFAILMPMKWHGGEDALPPFFKKPEPVAKAA